jgi:DNA-binding MarR family transcriptional regulator
MEVVCADEIEQGVDREWRAARRPVVSTETDWSIAELINELALLGVRRLSPKRRLLDAKQKMRLIPSFTTSLVKDGRPGFLLVADIARTLAIKGDLTISEIAEITGRPLGTASRFVDALEAAGLVRRSQNPVDGRSKLVGLTDAGQRVVSELRAEAGAPLVRRLERLTSAERRSLERLLTKLAAPDEPGTEVDP